MGNVTSNVAAKLAFFPPSPATYGVSKDEETGKLMFTGVTPEKNMDVHQITTKSGNKVVATFWKDPFARFTLIYSHGNAADLGQMVELFIELRAHLRVNVMSYDYSGYGASTGKPSEVNTYHDIEAVYNCLRSEYGIKQEEMVLYGQSVGSGPTLYLASRLKRLRGGTKDEVVNMSHGKRLWELSKDKYDPLWVKGGGHCNLESYPEYIKHLRKFINAMEKLALNNPPTKQADDEPSITKTKHNCCLRFRKK
ncbi:hypothetical protein YC2023_046353 [Brassica napus]